MFRLRYDCNVIGYLSLLQAVYSLVVPGYSYLVILPSIHIFLFYLNSVEYDYVLLDGFSVGLSQLGNNDVQKVILHYWLSSFIAFNDVCRLVVVVIN